MFVELGTSFILNFLRLADLQTGTQTGHTLEP